MKFSVVIPTYNRRHVLGNAIESALPLLRSGDAEVIVVDDGSQDGTDEYVQSEYAEWLASGHMKLKLGSNNEGVTAAKNRGGLVARGEWIVFLDSDDTLLLTALDALREVCRNGSNASRPVIFFRCSRRDGGLIGAAPLKAELVSAKECLTHWRWGECLPVVRTEHFRQFPYDSDLRGFESITYARLVKRFGSALVAATVGRTYNDTGYDRLSTRAQLWNRSCELGRGHWRVAHEFWRELGLHGTVASGTKAAAYSGACAFLLLKRTFHSPSILRSFQL